MERELVVAIPQGLHARPAAEFAKLAAQYAAEVTVAVEGRQASARGVLGVLQLGVRQGTRVRLRAEGPDAQAALAALSRFLGGVAAGAGEDAGPVAGPGGGGGL